MLPIPKRLLIHTATIKTSTVNSHWGGDTTDSEPITLSHIRIDPSHSITVSKENKQEQLTATLYYDCHNSSPQNQAFKVDDIVTFNSKPYHIKTIDPLYDGEKLHHYEIGLS